MINEIWRDIPGFEGFYQASSLGRVRSLTRLIRHGGPNKNSQSLRQGKIIKASDLDRGYLYVNLSAYGRGRMIAVHRCVASAFIGPIPKGMTVNHRNGVKPDNTPENLEIVSHAENIAHACITGLRNDIGANNNNAALTEADIIEIRDLLSNGISTREIADRFNVKKPCIWKISKGRTWKHLEPSI